LIVDNYQLISTNPQIWIPDPQAKTVPDPLEFRSVKSLWLELAHELNVADCILSLRINLHGHRYTANPLGCAVALASLDLLSKNESVYTKMESWHRQHLARLGDKYPQLSKFRAMGTI
jgi:adenosylmethionine-8-amino-7-oxononanoate aminotransferase